MRIEADFNIENWKCTLFRHDMRYTIQIENGPFVQSYKLGDPGRVLNQEEVNLWIQDQHVRDHIRKVFQKMSGVSFPFDTDDNDPKDELDIII